VRIFFQSVDDARDAVFDEGHLEVDEQPEALVGEPEIGQKLLLVDRSEKLDGFHFDNHLVFDDQVGPESGVDAETVVDYRNRLLPDNTEAPALQFVGQDCLLDGFQQARSQLGVNAKSRVHDLLGDGVLGHTGPSIVSRQDAETPRKCQAKLTAATFAYA